MPRVSGRDPAVVEEVLFEAFARAARDHLADADAEQPVLAVPVKNLLREVTEAYRDDPRGISPVTTGFIQAQYGGKQGFVDAALVHMLGPDGLDARRTIVRATVGLLVGDVTEVRNEAARMDLDNMLASEETARIWMLHIAYSRRPNVGAVTTEVYTLFERAYRALLRLELAMRGRRLSADHTIEDLALGHTALAEGLMVRLLGDTRIAAAERGRIVGSRNVPGLVGRWSNAILESMTEQVATPPGRPIVLVRSLVEMAAGLPDEQLAEEIAAVADFDDPAVMLFLGLTREQQGRIEGEPDSDTAVGWWRRAAERGDVDAQRLLGMLRYAQGRIDGDPDGDDAYGWWRKAAEADDPASTTNLGVLRATQGALDGNPEGDDAAGWWRRAAQMDDPAALINLGWLRHHEGRESGDPDGDDAGAWWARAREMQDHYVDTMSDPGMLWQGNAPVTARPVPLAASESPGPPRRIAVAVVERREVVREGVTAKLRAAGDINVAAAVSSASDLVADRTVADVVLLDEWPDDPDQGEAVEGLIAQGQTVVLYTDDERPVPLRRAVAAGAAGVLLQSDPLDSMVEGVRRVAAGEFYCSSALAEALLSDSLAIASLSGREVEILELLSQGYLQKQIARALGIGEGTVKMHLARARARFQAIGFEPGNTLDLIRLATRQGDLPR